MLIYGDNKRECGTQGLINDLLVSISRAESSSFYNHTHVVDLLIRYGEFESALTDRLCSAQDTTTPLIEKLRHGALITGVLFSNSLSENTGSSFTLADQLRMILSELSCAGLPVSLTISVPEGYAYYGLYPEMYFEAAKKFIQAKKTKDVVAIGIRSIGTSLSAVVSACLKVGGCNVKSITVRPTGDYFNRQLRISQGLRDELSSRANAYFLIIDEGPGLSGSSLCSTAEYISQMGIADDKIIFFPSWEPDSNNFVSESSKQRWIKHEKYTVSFEDAFLNNEKLAGSMPYKNLLDISAGNWRSMFYKDPSEYPPVFQNFEQRKYLVTKVPVRFSEGRIDLNQISTISKAGIYFIKFAGLGHYGQSLYERAVELHKAGYSPKASGPENGFIIYEFVNGRPLTVNDVNNDLLDRIASYIAFIYKNYPSSASRTAEEIKEMVRINLSKGLGENFAQMFTGSKLFSLMPEIKAWKVDGRMLPYEWLEINNRYIKTDSIHHHSDHSFPGCIDIAWDLAGSIVEFNLDETGKEYLIDKYIYYSQDTTIRQRLPFYLLPYLAFRLGYIKFAAERLGESHDKNKFILLAENYSLLIKNVLTNQEKLRV